MNDQILSAMDYLKGFEQRRADALALLSKLTISLVVAKSFLRPVESTHFDDACEIVHEIRAVLGGK